MPVARAAAELASARSFIERLPDDSRRRSAIAVCAHEASARLAIARAVIRQLILTDEVTSALDSARNVCPRCARAALVSRRRSSLTG
jgi:ABC-type lipoprotein export system ATPase subunit